MPEPVPSILLSSGQPTAWSRWSYQPSSPILRLRGAATGAQLRSARGVVRSWDDPLEALRFISTNPTAAGAGEVPFPGGWIGYLSYDLGRLFERLPARVPDPLYMPLFEFTFHPSVVATDNASGLVHNAACAHWFDPTPIRARAKRMRSNQLLDCTFTRRGYRAAVMRAIDYIAAGDVFQVNLSQRFSVGVQASPRKIYDRLCARWPAYFGALLDYGDYALVSNSPELFIRVDPGADGERRIVTRPIKGTRPRERGLDVELLRSEKDAAELNMIIDLERNDLGRVCRIGSVKVTQPRTIESHPTVHHGVATVEGVLRPDATFVDLLRATFPGGSITGAPKIRAMEIIEELEPVRRGPYCGAIGYIAPDGHMQFNIAIRTMILKGGIAHIQVGGGVVADSDPAEEYLETLVKAEAMMEAIGMGAPGM